MKKKVLVAGIVFAVAIMLFSMTPVLAVPKEKVDFALYIQGALPPSSWLYANGYLVGSPDKGYPGSNPPPPPEGYAVRHYINAPFNPTNVWLVVNGETILYSRLDYTAAISGDINWLTKNDNDANWKVDETVTIYTDASKNTVWGTLEINTVDSAAVGTFEGHGTGALEGVKVQGDSLQISGTRVREGIAMGWP